MTSSSEKLYRPTYIPASVGLFVVKLSSFKGFQAVSGATTREYIPSRLNVV